MGSLVPCSGRRKLSKEELEPALWRSIAEQEASEGMDVRDDDAEGGYVALCNPLGKRRRPLDHRLAALGSRAWGKGTFAYSGAASFRALTGR